MIFRRLSPRAKQKRLQRIVMGVLAAVLALGLIASSIAWTGGSQTEPPKTVEDRIKLLEGQAKKKPEDKGVLLPLAAHYSQVGKVEQATETYEKVLKLDPKNVSVHQELSLLYYTQGKSDKALQLLESALKIEPNNVEVNYQYANVLAEKKDYSAAITAMEKVTAAEKEGSRAEAARKSIEAWKMEVGQ
ncbi:tetratricopeptide repeat protein [Desulforamulus aeronauticus]|uniref:Tetratricopeptide repeat-containing protein n=1 Tax=Desulforamulus aeronauticus DSM 10349 TaxID=1121421 RepID=A0A1M6TC98_9FIRM|nr:tetratricopeptide repeat protein [Desulforamulus aeronauticus]SHK54398.1 Tetratricopeptide repeat-containing protein [Desulforamulus aeronauticus DSM 10349]